MSDSGAPAPSATVEGKPKMDIEEDDDDDEQAPAEQKGKTVGFKEEEEEEELDESDALLEHRVAIAIRPDEEAWKDATVGKTDVAVQQMYESALRSAHDALKASRDLDRVLEKEREEADASLREKEHAEAELKASLLQLVADTAKRATDSKGKPLPKGALADFEQRTAELEAALEEERTKNVKLRAAMRAIDQSMKRKEALRDGLHLIDFEQLKVSCCRVPTPTLSPRWSSARLTSPSLTSWGGGEKTTQRRSRTRHLPRRSRTGTRRSES